MLILIKRSTLLLQTCYDERSDFPGEVQGTLSYKLGLGMKKGRAFNASIKSFNGLKTLDKEPSEESNC